MIFGLLLSWADYARLWSSIDYHGPPAYVVILADSVELVLEVSVKQAAKSPFHILMAFVYSAEKTQPWDFSF